MQLWCSVFHVCVTKIAIKIPGLSFQKLISHKSDEGWQKKWVASRLRKGKFKIYVSFLYSRHFIDKKNNLNLKYGLGLSNSEHLLLKQFMTTIFVTKGYRAPNKTIHDHNLCNKGLSSTKQNNS